MLVCFAEAAKRADLAMWTRSLPTAAKVTVVGISVRALWMPLE
jgi:hypothetical protein